MRAERGGGQGKTDVDDFGLCVLQKILISMERATQGDRDVQRRARVRRARRRRARGGRWRGRTSSSAGVASGRVRASERGGARGGMRWAGTGAALYSGGEAWPVPGGGGARENGRGGRRSAGALPRARVRGVIVGSPLLLFFLLPSSGCGWLVVAIGGYWGTGRPLRLEGQAGGDRGMTLRCGCRLRGPRHAGVPCALAQKGRRACRPSRPQLCPGAGHSAGSGGARWTLGPRGGMRQVASQP